MYPTLKLKERAGFISDACSHVKSEINQKKTSKMIIIVSFSFVNTDLRTAFRDAFPRAQWILVDTDKNLAEERISAREGHFYKAESSSTNSDDEVTNSCDDSKCANEDNSDWEFRPVDFPHTALDGCDTVEANAKRIVECIAQWC